MAIRADHNKEEDNISHLTADNLISYETVKYFANEKREVLNLKKAFEPWTASLEKYMLVLRRMGVSLRAISFFAMMSILVFLMPDIVDKKISAGDFVLVFTFMIQIFPNIEKIMWRLRGIMRNYTDLKDYFDILDYPLVIKDIENPIAFSCDKGEVVFDNVSFSYPTQNDVLKNVNVVIPKGKMIAIVGRSGAGKTTLIDILKGFYQIKEGGHLVDGTPFSGSDCIFVVNQ